MGKQPENKSAVLQQQIALTLIPGIGNMIAKKLIAYSGSVEAIFKEKKKYLNRIPGVGEYILNSVNSKNLQSAMARAETEMAFIDKYHIRPIFYLDEAYPERLQHCIDSPVMLYYKGGADMNVRRILSVVGTRSATGYGRECCQRIIRDLASCQLLIVSGLAYGIDACAHRTAVECDLPTIGVLAHGLDMIYPATNRTLAHRMLDHGGLITEFLSASKPDREHFPKRNRIIAGMADAVLVIEAGKKGGALITAGLANSYDRDVFALPGRISDSLSEGCNHLIKTNQAALVQSAEDIIYNMGWQDHETKGKAPQPLLFTNLTGKEEALIRLLELRGEASIDWLSVNSGLPVSQVAAALLELEFKSYVKALPGRMFRLIS
jgi:DNA processing protein